MFPVGGKYDMGRLHNRNRMAALFFYSAFLSKTDEQKVSFFISADTKSTYRHRTRIDWMTKLFIEIKERG